MDTKRRNTYQARWIADHCTRCAVKLNHNTDADILAALAGKVKQTEIKRLIRVGLEAERKK